MHAATDFCDSFLLTEMLVTQMMEWRMNQNRKCSFAKPCVWPRETAINKAPLCDSSSLSSALSLSLSLSLSHVIPNSWSDSKKSLTYLKSLTKLQSTNHFFHAFLYMSHLKYHQTVTLKRKHVLAQKCGTLEGTKKK